MLLGILAAAAAVAGMIFGSLRRRPAVVVLSALGLVVVIAVWAFFWFNPY